MIQPQPRAGWLQEGGAEPQKCRGASVRPHRAPTRGHPPAGQGQASEASVYRCSPASQPTCLLTPSSREHVLELGGGARTPAAAAMLPSSHVLESSGERLPPGCTVASPHGQSVSFGLPPADHRLPAAPHADLRERARLHGDPCAELSAGRPRPGSGLGGPASWGPVCLPPRPAGTHQGRGDGQQGEVGQSLHGPPGEKLVTRPLRCHPRTARGSQIKSKDLIKRSTGCFPKAWNGGRSLSTPEPQCSHS